MLVHCDTSKRRAMNTLKMTEIRSTVLSPEGAGNPVDQVVEQSRAPSVKGPAREMQDSSEFQESGAPLSRRVAIKVKGTIHFINLNEIIAIQASGKYVSLEHGATTHLLRESFWRIAEMLEPCGFIRIHRSVLINASFVVEIRPRPATGGYCLRVAGGKEYQVTRKYKNNLKFLAEVWIGAGESDSN
jgi:DNA-binding LytR/AlgR family response regulator